MFETARQFTVLREVGLNTDEEFEACKALLEELGLRAAPDRRIQQPDGSILLRRSEFICLWDNEQNAQSFAEELTRRTNARWIVRMVESQDR